MHQAERRGDPGILQDFYYGLLHELVDYPTRFRVPGIHRTRRRDTGFTVTRRSCLRDCLSHTESRHHVGVIVATDQVLHGEAYKRWCVPASCPGREVDESPLLVRSGYPRSALPILKYICPHRFRRKVPFRYSSNACRSSSSVFITIGPRHATGSRRGFPEK